jgi:hypothetical protein
MNKVFGRNCCDSFPLREMTHTIPLKGIRKCRREWCIVKAVYSKWMDYRGLGTRLPSQSAVNMMAAADCLYKHCGPVSGWSLHLIISVCELFANKTVENENILRSPRFMSVFLDKNCLCRHQRVTKRCRLSWLTNSDLVYEPKCGGGGGLQGSQPMSTAVHRSSNKLWRSTPYLTYGRYPSSATQDKIVTSTSRTMKKKAK